MVKLGFKKPEPNDRTILQDPCYPHAFLKSEGDIVIASICLSVCPLCYLLNHWTNFNQIPFVSYTREFGVQRQTFFAPPPGVLGRGQNVKSHLISITVIFKDFYTKLVCVLTNERYKTYQTGFSFCLLGHALGVGLWGAWGAQGVIKNSKHGYEAYKIYGDDEQNRMQVKFSS